MRNKYAYHLISVALKEEYIKKSIDSFAKHKKKIVRAWIAMRHFVNN
jgi:hypothetical protein